MPFYGIAFARSTRQRITRRKLDCWYVLLHVKVLLHVTVVKRIDIKLKIICTSHVFEYLNVTSIVCSKLLCIFGRRPSNYEINHAMLCYVTLRYVTLCYVSSNTELFGLRGRLLAHKCIILET